MSGSPLFILAPLPFVAVPSTSQVTLNQNRTPRSIRLSKRSPVLRNEFRGNSSSKYFGFSVPKIGNRLLPSRSQGTVECSQTQLESKETEVLEKLKNVIDPDLNTDIVSAGFIKNMDINEDSGKVSFVLELTTPACPVKDLFKADAERYVEELPWVTKATAVLSSSPRQAPFATQARGLTKVASIVAVSSCKGGVGKSTVAVNLAFTLAQMGAKVGIIDADIYGPSLPVMISPDNTDVVYNADNLIVPIEYKGVKAMSFGFLQKGGQAAVMRGPIVSNVLNQLLTTTDWGELDYLVVDMPPGTGDIQLTLCQLVNITAAVIVTTPQKLSFIDVVKGLQMFDKVSVPSVAVVENMAYFKCTKCDEPHYLFGTGSKDKLVNQFGFRNSFSIPIDATVSAASDTGVPYILKHSDGEVAEVYRELASCVVQEVAKVKYGGLLDKPQIDYNKDAHRLEVVVPARYGRAAVSNPTGEPRRLSIAPAALRRRCRCALCVDEMSGAQVLDPESVEESIVPLSLMPVGNYALSVQWSDGHSSLFPYELILSLPASPAPQPSNAPS